MAEFSDSLISMLTEFMVCEVGTKTLDGITYTMVMKNAKDKELYDRYMLIKQEAIRCGYSSEEVFRTYEVSNGYIFDMDIITAKQMTVELSKAVARMNNNETPVGNLIGDRPEQRRKRDMVSLSRYLKSKYDQGIRQTEVALFSRNSSNKIILNGKGPKNETLTITYNAYALRHWDIERVNEQLLIPSGFRVSRIQPCEILPSKTGVAFIFTMESMEEAMQNYGQF